MARKAQDGLERSRVALRAVLDTAFQRAEQLIRSGSPETIFEELGSPLGEQVARMGAQQHHARGILLTLAACKAAEPSRDIRLYKDKFPGGFDARGLDLSVVIRFLREKQIPHAPPEGTNASH